MADRSDILDRAKALTCGDRDGSYGSPVENMADIARLWTAYLRGKYGIEFDLSGEDVAWMNTATKMARSYRSLNRDNYDDGAAYPAIAGECAFAERGDDAD